MRSNCSTLDDPDRLVIDTATSLSADVPPPLKEDALPDGVSLSVFGGLSLLSFDASRYAPHVVAAPSGAALSVAELVRLTGYRLAPGLGGRATFAFAVKGNDPVTIRAGFPVKADLADVPAPVLRRSPWYRTTSTWMRVARIIEGSETVALLVGGERIARSAGGVTITLETSPARWQGAAHRARLLTGRSTTPRVVRARG